MREKCRCLALDECIEATVIEHKIVLIRVLIKGSIIVDNREFLGTLLLRDRSGVRPKVTIKRDNV